MSARAAVEKLIAEIGEAQPEFDEFEKWRAHKAQALAELQAVRRETEKERGIHKDPKAEVAALRAEREKIPKELVVAQNDLHRTRTEHDALVQRLADIKRRNRIE